MKTPVTVRDYLRLLFRRKYALVGPIVCSVLLIIPLWTIIPPKYRADTRVRRKDLSLAGAVAGNLVARDNGPVPVETMKAEILTWTNLDRVIKQLKLDVDLKTTADWQAEYELLRKNITVKPIAQGRGVDLIEIAAVDTRPEIAQQIANAVADNYVEESQKTSREDTLKASQFFKKLMDDNLETVNITNTKLEMYMKKYWTQLPEVRKARLATLDHLHVTESTHLLLLSAAQKRLTEIQKQIEEAEKTIKTEETTQPNPVYFELQQKLQDRNKLLAGMAINYTEEHPQVKALREEIRTIEAQLKETPERVPGTIHTGINPVYQELLMSRNNAAQTVKEQEASLLEIQAQIRANEKDIQAVVEEEKSYGELQRMHDEAKDNYEQYHKSWLATENKLKIQSEASGTQVEIMSRALLPAIPWKMERLQIALECLGAAMAAGVALMFLLEFVDHSLRGAEDAASSLGVPVLATLTEIPASEDLDPHRVRMRRIAIGVGVAVFLCALTATTIEYFQPGTLHSLASMVRHI